MKTHPCTCFVRSYGILLFFLLNGIVLYGQQRHLDDDTAPIDQLYASALRPSEETPVQMSTQPELRLNALPLKITGSFTQGNVYIQDSLNIGLQSGATGYRLAVDGKIMCEELKIQNSNAWPDYVFAADYPLLELGALEAYIQQHQHLPGVPSASVIDQEGIHIGEMQRAMMEKIEELTLYIIQQDKRIAELESCALRKGKHKCKVTVVK